MDEVPYVKMKSFTFSTKDVPYSKTRSKTYVGEHLVKTSMINITTNKAFNVGKDARHWKKEKANVGCPAQHCKKVKMWSTLLQACRHQKQMLHHSASFHHLHRNRSIPVSWKNKGREGGR
jgi:hypothetical protein